MTRVVWNRVGERLYQTGVDRGVLYPQGETGVPWNGLISVNESSSGGDPKAYYIDGYMYALRPTREDFQGSIEAFMYPKEFERCDGTKGMGRGLHLGNQRRYPFGLSYRTVVGNDISGESYGYKLHIVYNALANPSSRDYRTISDDPEAITFNWSFSTKPIRVIGHKPIPHIIVDSHETQPSLLVALEDILYGSATTPPRLPTPTEVITLFEEWPEMTVIDNGDGTFTVDGPENVVSLLNSTTYQITSDAAIDGGNGTFTVASL
jgi:hypothetical protein